MSKFVNGRAARQTPSERLAEDLRGFGPAGFFTITSIFLLGTIIIDKIAVPFGALLALLWVKFSHTPWRRIGYVRPQSWLKTTVAGILFGCTFKLVSKSIIMPLLGAPPLNLLLQHLAGNTALLPFAAWSMLVAGFAEETVFRGFAFNRLQKLLGTKQWATVFIVILTAVFFGLAHYPQQGYTGAQHATVMGLVFGTVYGAKGSLFLLMLAHASYNLTAIALIYWGLEGEVAHYFFR